MAKESTPNTSLNIGVLLLPSGAQLLDTSPVDLFAMTAKTYLQACQLPGPLIALGLDVVNISYICECPNVELTANLRMTATCGLDAATVSPGKLDVLMIPGPDPAEQPSEAAKEFVRAHFGQERTSILTMCTGVFITAHSGILKGKRVTGPRGLLPMLRKTFPETEWVDKRWESDGRIWCSAGITNGQDMVAAFMRDRLPGALCDTVCGLADVGDRGKEYPNGQVAEVSWWLWLIARSWMRGLFHIK